MPLLLYPSESLEDVWKELFSLHGELPFSQSDVNLPKTSFTKELELVNEMPQKIILYEDDDKFLIMNYYGLGPIKFTVRHGDTFGIAIDLITNYGLKNISIPHLLGDYEETFQIGPDEIHLKLINAERHNERGIKWGNYEGIFHKSKSNKST